MQMCTLLISGLSLSFKPQIMQICSFVSNINMFHGLPVTNCRPFINDCSFTFHFCDWCNLPSFVQVVNMATALISNQFKIKTSDIFTLFVQTFIGKVMVTGKTLVGSLAVIILNQIQFHNYKLKVVIGQSNDCMLTWCYCYDTQLNFML